LEKTANGKNDNQINNIDDESSKNWLIKYIPAGKLEVSDFSHCETMTWQACKSSLVERKAWLLV